LVAPDISTFALFSHKPGTPKSSTQQPHYPKHKQQFHKYPPRGSSQSSNGGLFQHPKGASSQYPNRDSSQYSNGFSPKPFSTSPQPHLQQHFVPNQPSSKPLLHAPCQKCDKISYQDLDCFHRMDYAYQGWHSPLQLAAIVAQNNNYFDDSKWFADCGANVHITNDLETLTIQ
jgi:hypothetical protein